MDCVICLEHSGVPSPQSFEDVDHAENRMIRFGCPHVGHRQCAVAHRRLGLNNRCPVRGCRGRITAANLQQEVIPAYDCEYQQKLAEVQEYRGAAHQARRMTFANTPPFFQNVLDASPSEFIKGKSKCYNCCSEDHELKDCGEDFFIRDKSTVTSLSGVVHEVIHTEQIKRGLLRGPGHAIFEVFHQYSICHNKNIVSKNDDFMLRIVRTTIQGLVSTKETCRKCGSSEHGCPLPAISPAVWSLCLEPELEPASQEAFEHFHSFMRFFMRILGCAAHDKIMGRTGTACQGGHENLLMS